MRVEAIAKSDFLPKFQILEHKYGLSLIRHAWRIWPRLLLLRWWHAFEVLQVGKVSRLLGCPGLSESCCPVA